MTYLRARGIDSSIGEFRLILLDSLVRTCVRLPSSFPPLCQAVPWSGLLLLLLAVAAAAAAAAAVGTEPHSNRRFKPLRPPIWIDTTSAVGPKNCRQTAEKGILGARCRIFCKLFDKNSAYLPRFFSYILRGECQRRIGVGGMKRKNRNNDRCRICNIFRKTQT